MICRCGWSGIRCWASPGRWKIVANTLGDLTKRENRYEHHLFGRDDCESRAMSRVYPIRDGVDRERAIAAVTLGFCFGSGDAQPGLHAAGRPRISRNRRCNQ